MERLRALYKFIGDNWLLAGILSGLLATAIWVYGADLRQWAFPREPSGGTAYDDGFTQVSEGGSGYAMLSSAIDAFEANTGKSVHWADMRDHQIVYCRDFVEPVAEDLLDAFAEQFTSCLGVREMPNGVSVELRPTGATARSYLLGEGGMRYHFCECLPERIEAATRNLQLTEP